MRKILCKASLFSIIAGLFSCQKETTPVNFHERYMLEISKLSQKKEGSIEEMILVKGGEFLMGGVSEQARADEFPIHNEIVDDFYIDIHEVTNAQFAEFVDATNYVTTAERPIDSQHIAKISGVSPKQISETDPAALVFTGNPQMWWAIKKGADWKHPKGPESSIEGKENYPVIQISWYDAMAYCHWAKKRLPTEEEYEYVARNRGKRTKYTWGNDYSKAKEYTNFHQGTFPNQNLKEDHYEGIAPVKSFKKNELGIYDISGNVWEWTLNSYFPNGYQKKVQGERTIREKDTTYWQKKVIRGGSFLCNESYCSGYRASARMSSTPDSSLEHVGFRCVKNVN